MYMYILFWKVPFLIRHKKSVDLEPKTNTVINSLMKFCEK